jgi:hypothetical protein
MEHHAERLKRLKELFTMLEAAIAHSYAVREVASALSDAAAELAKAAPPERRSKPRTPGAGKPPRVH